MKQYKLSGYLKVQPLVIATLIIFVVCALLNKAFLSPFSLLATFQELSIFSFLVMGQVLVLLTGGIDLSVGNMASLSTVLSAFAMTRLYSMNVDNTMNCIISIVFAVGFCTIMGAASGFMVAKMKLPPLIATLGMMWIVKGLAYYFLKGVPTQYPINEYKDILIDPLFIGKGYLSAFPVSLIYVIIATGLLIYTLSKLRFGRQIYAVGGNEYAAYLSGVDTNKIKILIYTLSGMLAGIGGLLVGAFSTVGYPRACDGYEMYAIAAAVMGGVSLAGGKGKLSMALVGIFSLRLLNKFVVFSGISSYFEGMFIGAIIILMLILSHRNIKEEAV